MFHGENNKNKHNTFFIYLDSFYSSGLNEYVSLEEKNAAVKQCIKQRKPD